MEVKCLPLQYHNQQYLQENKWSAYYWVTQQQYIAPKFPLFIRNYPSGGNSNIGLGILCIGTILLLEGCQCLPHGGGQSKRL